MEKAVSGIVRSIGELHGAKVEVKIKPGGTPALINTNKMASLAREPTVSVVGKEKVRGLHTANMDCEDFRYYLEHVEGCYARYST